jgi:hypothetical protein
VLNSAYWRLLLQLKHAGMLKRALFNWAFRSKLAALKAGYTFDKASGLWRGSGGQGASLEVAAELALMQCPLAFLQACTAWVLHRHNAVVLIILCGSESAVACLEDTWNLGSWRVQTHVQCSFWILTVCFLLM